MLNNNQNIFEHMDSNVKKRTLHIQFSNQSLNQHVYLHHIQGKQALNQGIQTVLLCLSEQIVIPVEQFIGSQVAVDCQIEDGRYFRMSGIVMEAEQGHSDGHLTVYQLHVQDPLALWKYRHNSRVFMAKSVVEIVEIIFSEWKKISPLFASSLLLELKGLEKTYPIRPFTMQQQLSDEEFIKNLLRQEQINFLIDEASAFVNHPSCRIEAQRLCLIDDNKQFAQLTRQNITYQRSPYSIKDRIHCLVEHGALVDMSWKKGAAQQNSDLEHLIVESSILIPELKADVQGSKTEDMKLIQRYNKLGSDQRTETRQFVAYAHVDDAQVGCWFELEGHPNIGVESSTDRELLIIAQDFYKKNELTKVLDDQIMALSKLSHWSYTAFIAYDSHPITTLTLQLRSSLTVPEYNPVKHRVNARPQRAEVIGPIGEEVYVDEWGRIKVHFLLNSDQYSTFTTSSVTKEKNAAWVNVLAPWASSYEGKQFLPKIGDIVVVDFFDGNIDQPFVVGRIHDGQQIPIPVDIKARLPDTQKLNDNYIEEMKAARA